MLERSRLFRSNRAFTNGEMVRAMREEFGERLSYQSATSILESCHADGLLNKRLVEDGSVALYDRRVPNQHRERLRVRTDAELGLPEARLGAPIIRGIK